MRRQTSAKLSYYKTVAACSVLFLLLVSMPCSSLESGEGNFSTQELLLKGQRMYREGILPSGEPVQAFVQGDIPVAGTTFSCVSCHLRSGLGSFEGNIVTPPTTGQQLFRPRQLLYPGIGLSPESSPLPLWRPAYTDQSLAAVIRSGIDPTGRILDFIMPRYLIPDDEMAIMISYLKSLSSDVAPGVTETTLRFATVITDDVSPEDQNAMLAPIEYYIRHKNNQIVQSMFRSWEPPQPSLSLSRWILRGPPETWRCQLEEYYHNDPVFALIGGISRNDWRPIHEFSEAHQIPSLFPQTDFPVISDTDWYTLYLSKGYYQEGEGVARYLNSIHEVLEGKTVVQIVAASSESRALLTGFQNTWRDLGHQSPVTIRLGETELFTVHFLQQMLSREKPSVLILWVGPEALPALESLAVAKDRAEMVFISSGYIGNNFWSLPEQVRDFTFLSYPFSLPQDDLRYAVHIEQLSNSPKPQGKSEKILPGTYAVTRSLSYALMDMKGNYYRDNLLDIIGMMPDQDIPLYERLSFGAGQRYASKGCYIVQLGKGPSPKLIKKSDWVIH